MNRRLRASLGLIPAIVIAFVTQTPSPARAQSGAAEAEQLFRDGKRLMQDKKFAEACGAFETSYKLDAALTTKLNLADCREKNGQLATAWGLFVDAERDTRADAKQKALNRTAKDRATALEPRLSYLTISVADESRVEGLSIQRNGAPFDEGMWNRAVPVDGGAIVIAGRAPGHEEWTTTANVPLEGAKVSVEVPRFKELKKLVDDAGTEPVGGAEPLAAMRDDGAENPGTFTRRRKVAIGIAGVGVAALVAAAWLGTQARGFESDALDRCPEPSTPCAEASEAQALNDRAASRALCANVGFGVGAAAIVGAALLWFTGAPEGRPAMTAIAPRVQPGFAGIDVAVRF